ncbi:prolipoprotein diacylglyceryl transferase [Schleiferilactobacillus perolens]|jgi:phosphatidylglycerol:prolipoprotein diacylglycerol transferase|uniref:prolipoprotein diacylglyceryl transferase n=1 Tax=Schleiferilactobacillus perolens TaxID=100468 RepID=UPI0023566B15|nr:prolipoprotein diacylglyceryl transferase [Schleiferilactobacillus perolens]MCI2170226.1 prolipoprotein diacylglyceryl transferase [Schleiferilactobacillus perolens]
MSLLAALDPVALRLGPLQIKWYGVLIATGVVLAVILSMREADRRQISPDDIVDLLLWMLPIGVIGARLYYVIFRWSYYANNFGEIFAIWHGGLAIYGGIIAGLAVLLVYCYYRMLPTWLVLDIIAPTVLLAQAIGRWGNFMNQEAFGATTTRAFLEGIHLPNFIINQMYINGLYRQPDFLYESTWSFLGVILLLSLRHRTHLFKQGEVALSYIAWYSFARFWIEGTRTDSLYLFGPIRVSQLLSDILFVVAVGLIIYRRRAKPNNPWYLDGSGLKYPYER